MQRAANHGLWRRWLTGLMLFGLCVAGLRSQTATGITGLYFTGVNNSGALLAGGGTRDAHWQITYTTESGGTGSSYVVNSTVPASTDWTDNTASAQWITAINAYDANGANVNKGYSYLTGNGTGANMGIFVYRLAFTITGTGSGTVTNNVAISLTISADDQFRIYMNPAGNGTTLPTESAAATAFHAWDNTTAFTLANFDSSSTTNNSIFKIGINYLVVVVENTNNRTGETADDPRNMSGLLFYQQGQNVVIGNNTYVLQGGRTVPEVGTWLPTMGVLGLLGGAIWRRRLRAVAVGF